MELEQLQIDPHNPDLLVVQGPDSRGRSLDRSLDGGLSWQDLLPPTRQNFEPESTSRLVCDPVNPKIVYSVGWPAQIPPNVEPKNKLWQTNGNAWQDLSQFFSPRIYGQLLDVYPVSENINLVYAMTKTMLLRSENQGTSWLRLSHEDGYGSVLAVFPTGQRLLWGTHLSQDWGAHWTEMPAPGFSQQELLGYRLVPDSDFVVANTLSGYFLSQDRGETWKLFARQSRAINDAYRPTLGQIVISPGGARAYAIGFIASKGFVLEKSSDGGQNWSELSTALPENGELQISGTPEVLYLQSKHRLWRSRNQGQSWERVSLPVKSLGIAKLVASPAQANSLWALTTAPADIYHSQDKGLTWRLLPGKNLPENVCCLLQSSQGKLFIGSPQYGVFRSEDGGESWQAINDGIDNWAIDYLGRDPVLPKRLYARAKSHADVLPGPPPDRLNYYKQYEPAFYQSDDEGQSWKQMPFSQDSEQGDDFARAPGEPAVLIRAGIDSSGEYSRDQGLTWQKSEVGLPAKQPLTFLLADPVAPVVYGLTAEGVYRTFDQGKSWQRLDATQNLGATSLEIGSADPGSLYLATPRGIFQISLDRSHYPK